MLRSGFQVVRRELEELAMESLELGEALVIMVISLLRVMGLCMSDGNGTGG
jgi:hypothetical protein